MMLGEFASSAKEKPVVSCAATAETADSATSLRKARVMGANGTFSPRRVFWPTL